jgi:hypothetical protein
MKSMAKDEKKPKERPGMTRRPDKASSWRVSGYNNNPPLKK